MISKKYKNALDFWNDVRGKRFTVELLGNGFTLNLKNDLVKRLRILAMRGAGISDEAIDQSIYDYIRNAVNDDKTSEVSGTLKYKKAYRLIEI